MPISGKHVMAAAMLMLLLASGCHRKQPDGAASGEVMLHDSMVQVVVPQAQAIWDITNGAMKDDGTLDAAKLKDKDWAAVTAAAGLLKARFNALATARHVTVIGANEKIEGQASPESLSPKQIQTLIDGDMASFRAHAGQLRDIFQNVLAAAAAHDGAKLGTIANALDQQCEGCHKQFWFPDAKKGGGNL